jgi:thiol-disulfide isomerase/thioredoxin
MCLIGIMIATFINLQTVISFFFFMVRIIPLILFLSLIVNFVVAQTKVVKFAELEAILKKKEGPVQVINFWATWCGPCVKELPMFEQVNTNNTNIKVTLISLDFADKLDKVDAFIARKNMKSEVLLLDDIDYNSWIDKVEKSWEGAIPATLIFNPTTGKRVFTQHELKEGELEKLIESVQ